MSILTRQQKGAALTHAEMDDNLSYLVPPGAVMAFARNTAPNGWLECSGAAVSRTTYADLFAAIGTTFGSGNGSTTFNLPNLRGEFIRGWDNGRGVDDGRSFGSAQADAFEAHTHLAPTSNGQGGVYEVPAASVFTGYDYGAQSAPTTSTGDSETRPRNIAMLYCIKI